MQGDIFYLSEVQQQVPKSGAPKKAPKPKATKLQVDPAVVSIWNDDDLSEYLYLPSRASEEIHIHTHPASPDDHAHFLERIAEAFDDYCTDTTPHESSDECAVFSDVEDDEDDLTSLVDYDLATLHSGAASGTASPKGKEPAQPLGGGEMKMAQKPSRVRAEHHVDYVSGSIMSWWPLPPEMQEYDWEICERNLALHPDRHVDHISGSLMSWWPPVTNEEYEWNEKFYE